MSHAAKIKPKKTTKPTKLTTTTTTSVEQNQTTIAKASTSTSTSTSTQQQKCGLYVAESLHEPGSMALFSGIDYDKHEHDRIGLIEEVIWPFILPNMNEYSPWHDFNWDGHDVIPEEYVQNNATDVVISGIGALSSCGRDDDSNQNRFNVLFDHTSRPSIMATTTTKNLKPSDFTAGSFSELENFGFTTTSRGLKAGEELFLNCDATKEDDIDDDDNDNDEEDDDSLRLVRDLDWLEENGACLDNLIVKPSTLPGNVGRGAFSKYAVSKDSVIATSPLLHFDRSQTEIVEQQYKEQDQHKIPLVREHGIEYQNSKVLGHQLVLNYCFGHPDSNMLLLPLAPGVNFINHVPHGGNNSNSNKNKKKQKQTPNAYIRWSSKLADSQALREKKPLMELLQLPAGALMIEYVALTDIQAGDEIFLDYGTEWQKAWEEHVSNWDDDIDNNTLKTPFRHEIGVPKDLYPQNWMRKDPNPNGDFIGSPLPPGHMAPIRWKKTAQIVTPWAFRIGLPSTVREVLLDYCNKMGITDILRHVTVEGNELEPGTETHMDIEGDDWYLQRPEAKWKSNLHWFSPGAGPAHEHYLQALSVAGFDQVLDGIAKYLDMEGLVAFHVTFIGVSHSTKGYLHHDVENTGAKVYNVIIPLILANETGPELDLQEWRLDLPDDKQTGNVGRYRYEYDVASMMGDGAVHATSAVDYRKNKEMRMAATVYVADVNEDNIEMVMNHYTQAYPPNDIELLRSWKGRHWKRDDPSRKLPHPTKDHILVKTGSIPASAEKTSPKKPSFLGLEIPSLSSELEDEDSPVEEL